MTSAAQRSAAGPALTPAPRAGLRRRTWSLLLVAATLLAYAPIWRAGFVWDDDSMLTANKLVQADDGLRRLWFTTESQDYWPVTYSSLWLEWRLWGGNATGYHATNLGLHLAEAFLLWAILARLRLPGAPFAALLFAVHPVNVESVAWIAQRKNVAALLFFLLSLWCYLRADPRLGGEREARTRWPWWAASLVLFALAVLAKGSAAILPAILAVLVWWRARVGVPDGLRLGPFFAVAAAGVMVNIWFQSHGAELAVRDDGPLERVLGAAGVLWFYLSKALLPLGLTFIYPRWTISPAEPHWWAGLAAAVGVTVFLWRARQRGDQWRGALVAWMFFVVALLPVMGFADVYFMRYTLVADHYQHIALLGVVAALGGLWSAWHARAATVARAAAALLVVGWSALTFSAALTYRDEATLWRATLDANPGCALAHNNVGTTLLAEGKPAAAAGHFQAALAENPRLAETHFNLGKAFAALPGRLPDAVQQFEAALQLKPRVALVHLNLASALARLPGRRADAVTHYEIALRTDRDNAEAHSNLGLLLGADPARLADAIAHGERAIALKADVPEAQFNLANNLAKLPARHAEAIAHYETALRLKPDYVKAHINLGLLLARRTERHADAIRHYEAALALEPQSAVTHNNLAIVLAEAGRLDDARRHFEQAVQIDPNYADARNNLVRLEAMRANRPN